MNIKNISWKKVLLWTIAVLVIVYASLVVIRMFHFYNLKKTNEQVAKIHATKLTLDDVMGKNLPRDPGEEADKTIEGVDANSNGIRDDVELAIFKEYPNSAKTRAVLLQYALALQMEMKQPIVNEGTVVAVVQEEGSAFVCVGEILSRDDLDKYGQEGDKLRSFVENRQLNTEERKKNRSSFYKKIGSHESLDKICDINLSLLSN